MINKKIYLSMIFLLAGILMLGNVLAFAVSSQYWEENPLTINPGESQQAYIVLQNMAGTETVNARVGVLKGSNIVTMDEPEKVYEVPVGQRIEVYFTVNIPQESQVGGTQEIVFDITTINQEETGPMTFGSGAQKLIPVLVTAKPEVKKGASPIVYYLIAGVMLLIVVVLVVSKLKKRR